MRRSASTLLAPVLVTLGLVGPPALAKTYIDIDSPGFRGLPVAVVQVEPDPQSTPCKEPGLSEKITKVLLQDMDVSGYFQILPPEAFLVEAKDVKFAPEGVDFRAWSLIGAEALILHRTSCERDQVIFEAQLLDVLTGKVLTWKRYRSPVSAYRVVAHRFANEIELQLTGLAGTYDTRVAYVAKSPGAKDSGKELYVMDYDGNGAKRLSSLKSICLSPSWSPDGRRIAFTSFYKTNPSVYILDIAGGSELRRLCGTFYRLCSGASWSPDGKWVSFSASISGNSELFRVRLGDSGPPARLTDDWGIDVSPSWSPDGKQIAFVSDRAGRPDLYVLTPEDGTTRRLTFEGSYNADPDWSPRGDWIVFAGRVDGEFQIFRIRPDGTQRTQLTYAPGNGISPSFSPNGRLVAFSSNQAGPYEIYLIRADGSGRKRITLEGRDASDPSWGPLTSD
ncbi:MAG: Tol-Pal system beta propeller repeat protein TolB [bacterium]